MVDNDRLIPLVQERRPLWDVSCKSYHNREISRKLWQEIAEELNTSDYVVKARWQNLRVHFRKELGRTLKPTFRSSSSWKYFDQLYFLAGMYISKNGKLNNLAKPASQQVDVISEDEVMFLPMVDLEVSNGSAQVPDLEAALNEEDPPNSASSKMFKNQSNQMKRKLDTRNEADPINQFLQLEMRKMEQFERMEKIRKTSEDLENDEDYHFLMSLLPYLRDIPKNKKLSTRMRLQQVMVDAAGMGDVRTSISTHH